MEGAVVVTGSSRGIGAATARLAAGRGYAVALTYRSDRAGAEAVAGEIGGDAIALQADIAREDDIAACSRRWTTGAGSARSPAW